MYIRTVSKQSFQKWLGGFLFIAMGFLFLGYPDAVATGISRGLSLCTAVVIPTIYPFLLLSGLLANSALCRQPGAFTRQTSRWLFGLPGCCGPVILLSLVGGFPSGMLAAAGLYRQGQITPGQWRRLSAFCVGGGPGFIIGTVGCTLLGNRQAGVMLYAAQVIATLIIGVWLGRGHRKESDLPRLPAPARPFAHILGDTCGSLLTVCGYVVAAAMVLSLSEGIGLVRGLSRLTGLATDGIGAAWAGLLEVSCGCVAAAGLPGAPLWLSLMLSWTGLSVQGQLAATLPEERLLGGYFWGWRAVHGLIAGGVTLVLFWLFPIRLSTGNSATNPLPFSVSWQASVILLFFTFLAMLYFSEKKTGKTQ